MVYIHVIDCGVIGSGDLEESALFYDVGDISPSEAV
jgi:hypothetical protein